MVVTTKKIEVRASAGNGSQNPVDAAVRQYCAALARVQPTSAVSTGDLDEDAAQVHLCAVAKGAQLDPDAFQLVVTWRPHDYHTVDPANPSVWSANGANSVGIVYEVQVNGGVQYIGVCAVPI